MKIKNHDKIIIGNLNINSICNKFDSLKSIIPNNIDILVITETKLDETFPISQFVIDGYKEPYRLDRNRKGGGILIYVREDIPSKKLIKHTFPSDIEGIFVEINLRKTKWLLFGSYHPPSQKDEYYFQSVGRGLDIYNEFYEKFLLIGDFNAEDTESCLSTFLFQYDAKNIVKDKTCFKNPNNPSCIDLFITNSSKCFQNTLVLATGLSDFHKMAVTVLKTNFTKAQSKEIQYRDYKKFDKKKFREEIRNALSSNDTQCTEYTEFENKFLYVLNKHAPLKKKIVRANHKSYMTKNLRKAIMRRSALQNKYFKSGLIDDCNAYKRQKNYCSRLYKKERKKYFKNLNLKDITDNKKFWKTIKPLLSNKGSQRNKITIVKEGKVISEDKNVSESLNDFFKNAVDSLDISENRYLLEPTNESNDSVEFAISKFNTHPSILKIKEKINTQAFSFSEVSLSEIEKELENLNPKKANTYGNIPAKHLKQTSDICSTSLHKIVNETINKSNFPSQLKHADISPVFKKDDATNVQNYRPVSVLPAVSKIFERIMQRQIVTHIDKYLSPFLCGFRKGFNTQHALIALIEKWKSTLDKHGFAGAILMDLSKAFDTLNHDLLLAKLHAYGFDKKALLLVKSYLTNRWQRTKINTSFSSWSELLQGVPQGSVLGPLLFNIYINDLFLINEETDVCNYADDTTFYACDQSLHDVVRKLEHDSLLAIEWFDSNYMKLNQDKCQLLISGFKYESIWATIGKSKTWEKRNAKLLGINIDRDLKFDNHVSTLCKKAGCKLTALCRLTKFLPFYKRRILLKSFVESQFAYCPLTWMFHGREINNKINRLHERALRVIYRDDISSFSELLTKDGSVSIHHRNIQSLAIELYKSKHNLSPQIIQEIFLARNYEGPTLRSQTDFKLPKVNSVYAGTDSLRFLGPKVWDIIPSTLKNITSLETFKREIKKWIPSNCPCRICKSYIQGIGYI